MALARTLQGSTNLGNTTEDGSHDGTLDCGTVTSGGMLIVSAAGTASLTATNPAWTTPAKSSGTATIGTPVLIITDTPGADFDTFSTSWRIPVTGGGTLVLSVGDTGTTYGAGWTCIQYTGQDETTPIAGAVAAASNATSIANLTLGATPAAGDEVVQVVAWDTDAASGKGQTVGTNFTQRYSLGGTGDYVQMHVATRAGSVSTSTTVVPATQDGTPGVYTGTAHAFIVKAAAGGSDASPPAATVTGTASVGTPTVAVGASPTASTVTGNSSVGTPTVAVSTFPPAATVTGNSSVGTPTVTAGTFPPAATVTGAASVGTPTLTATATITAATITATAVVPTPVATAFAGRWPTTVDSSGRFILDQYGDPWTGMGDTAWSAIVELTDAEIVTYIDGIVALGFNMCLINAIDQAYGTNSPNNIDNESPFTGTILQSSLNEAYWERFDLFIDYAGENGITVLVCTNYFGFSDSDGFQGELASASNAQCLAYGQALGSRCVGKPNIMWAAGGDSNPNATLTARQQQIIDGIKEYHSGLWTGHTGPTGTDTAAWTSDHWSTDMDFEFGYQQGTTLVPEFEAQWAAMPGTVTTRPILMGEGGYWDDPFGSTSRPDLRRDMGTVLAGAYVGFLYGDNPRWHFNGDASGTGTWQDSLTRASTLDMSRFAALYATYFDASAMVPDTTGTFVTSGKSSGATEAAASFAAALGSKLGAALVYVQTTGSITVDLTELAGIAASVRFRAWDPTNGTFGTATSYATSGSQSISHPGANAGGDNDWVYVFDLGDPEAVTVTATASVGTPTVVSSPTIAATTVTATGSVGTPTVTVAVTVTASTVTAAASVGTPTVTATADVAASTVTGAAQVGAPTITAAADVPAPTISGAAQVGTPTMTATATITASTVTATGEVTATVTTGEIVTAATVTGAAVVGTPTVALSPTAAAGTVTGTAVVGAPTVTIDATPTAATVTGAAEVGAPTVTSGTLVSAPTVTAAAVVINPSLVIDTAIAVVTITASGENGQQISPTISLNGAVTGLVSVGTPTVESTSGPTAATVTATGIVGTPSITATGSVAAGTVTGTAVVETPTVTVGSGVTIAASTVTATAVIPTATVTVDRTAVLTTVTATAAIGAPTLVGFQTIVAAATITALAVVHAVSILIEGVSTDQIRGSSRGAVTRRGTYGVGNRPGEQETP